MDEKDTKWVLLGKIISAVSSRRVKQEMAKQGVGPVNMAGVMLRIVLIAMFFSVDISYVVKQRAKLNRRIKLRRFAKVGEIPEAKEIYRFLSRFSEEQFVGFISGVLSSICAKRRRNKRMKRKKIKSILAPSVVRPIIQKSKLISCIFTLILLSNSKSTQ